MERLKARISSLITALDTLATKVDSGHTRYRGFGASDERVNLLLTKKGMETFIEIGNYIDKIDQLMRKFLADEELLKACERAGIDWDSAEKMRVHERLLKIKNVEN